MRIDKFLAHSGFGTRKDVKKLLKTKVVSVNDKIIVKDNTKIDENNDIIKVNDQVISFKEFEYYLLNKPAGYVSATYDKNYPTVVELIQSNKNLFPVGRLDIDTEGLLILTNDGQFAHHLTSPHHHIPKVYEVIADGLVTDEDINIFKKGIEFKEFKTQPSVLDVIEQKDFKSLCHVTIYEGKFHQVKKMFLYIDKPVLHLKRIKMGALKLDNNLSKGEYRELTKDELNRLMK